MTALAKFQQQFMQAILTGGEVSAVENAAALQVYRNNVRFILTDVLAAIYPVTQKLVGTRFFSAMAQNFMQKNWPQNGDMHLYGADLPAFVAQFPPAAGLPYLADVAALEWAWHCAYYAPAHQPLSAKQAKQLAVGERTTVCFAPCAQLVQSSYPIFAIWQANRSESEKEIELEQGGDSLLVYRQGAVVDVWRLTDAETSFLQALQQQKTFVEAAAQLTDVAQSQTFFTALLRRGVLTVGKA